MESEKIFENPVFVADVESSRKGNNYLILSEKPIMPLICVQGLKYYYTPSEICKFFESVSKFVSNSFLIPSYESASFIGLLLARNIEDAICLMSILQKNTVPICSIDILSYDFVARLCFESHSLKFITNKISGFQDCNETCVICLNHLISDYQLLTFGCGHTVHTHCIQDLTQWECPLCRFCPITLIGGPCCESCGSKDKLFICLCCAKSFCLDHCYSHFIETSHPYCSSSDGYENLNLLSGKSVMRIAMDKSGELVELCAKEDQIHLYIEAVMNEELSNYNRFAAFQLENLKKEQKDVIDELSRLVESKEKELESERALVKSRDMLNKRKKITNDMYHSFISQMDTIESEISAIEKEIICLNKSIIESEEMKNDMEGAALISMAAGLKSKNQEIHINLKTQANDKNVK